MKLPRAPFFFLFALLVACLTGAARADVPGLYHGGTYVGSIDVGPDQTVRGDLTVFFGDVIVEGVVDGNINVIGGRAYARPGATDHELVEACEAAQIWGLISVLPDGLDTVVGDRGYRLSGGEKQRVALARLLLKAPSVVVLDEATAHLDSESEAAVQRALKTALTGRTSLVIAHRLSTVREADQILVIDAGRVTERGTHDELLAAGGLYAELYQTQFARQEIK